LRSGGDAGAKNFKIHCLNGIGTTGDTIDDPAIARPAPPAWKRGATNSLKTEIYANVRNALRFF